MAARRNKNQARRNGGSNGTPGWMWLVIGAVLAAVAFLVVPGLLKKDGFDPLKPTPNPDAQPPAQIAEADIDATTETPTSATTSAEPAPKPTQYEFYDLLPGKEVQMSDAELAASAREEQAREQRAQAVAARQQAADAVAGAPAVADAAPKPLAETAVAPKPVSALPEKPATTVASAAPAADAARYILQAGAFGASGDAESTKAKIAMLGLSARVESAQINGKTVYRVRMGPYGTASELAEAKQKLAGGGLPAMAIKAQ